MPVPELDPFSLDVFVAVLAAVVFLTMRRPALGAIALVLAGPFDFARSIGDTTLTLEKAALVGLALGLLFRRTGWAVLRTRPVAAVALALVAVLAATALSVHAAEFRGPALRETFKAAEYLFVFVLAALAVAADPDEALLGGALAVVAIVVALAACADLVSGAHSAVLVAGHPVPRIAGPLEGPNQLAGWLDLLLPVLFARAIRGRDPLSVVAFVLAALALALTLSRAGIVAALIGVGVVVVWSGAGARATALRLGALVAVVVAGAIAATGAGAHVFSAEQVDTGNGLATRAQLWQAAIALWRTHPLLGIGAGNFELRLSEVGLLGVRTHANDYYLQSLVEGGIPLLGAGLAATFAWLAALVRGRSALVLGVFAAGIAFALHQLVDDLAFYPKVGDLAWSLVGIAAALRVQAPTRERSSASSAASSTARV